MDEPDIEFNIQSIDASRTQQHPYAGNLAIYDNQKIHHFKVNHDSDPINQSPPGIEEPSQFYISYKENDYDEEKEEEDEHANGILTIIDKKTNKTKIYDVRNGEPKERPQR